MAWQDLKWRHVAIRTKIAALLGVLVIIFCCAGLFSIDRLMRVHETTIDINQSWLPSVRYIGDIRYNMARHRAIISRHIMVFEPDQKRQVESRAALAAKNVDNARKLYEPLINSPAERAAYDAFVQAWEVYLAACAKMLAVSSLGDSANAMKLFVEDISSVGLKAESTLDKIFEINLAGANAAESAGTALYDSSRLLLAAAIGFAIFVAVASGYFLTASVAKPVRTMTRAMTQLAEGQLDVSIPATGQRDEIGSMADAVLVFKQQAIENRRQGEREAEAEAQAAESRKQAIIDMAGRVETETGSAVEAIEATAREVDRAAQEMSQFAATVSTDTQSVAEASGHALGNAEAVSAAAEQLSSSIQEITSQIVRTAEVAQRAVASGETAAGTFRSLTDAVAKISDVTKLIGDVASQTNLLALNATIEAARAGDAGRGFAVVAAEVKNLASQTARSTDDINRQIEEIQTVTSAAVKAMAEVGDRIREIDESTKSIAGTIEQQGAATQEIANNVSETASAAREVSQKIQNVSAGAEQVDGRARSVRASIGDVTEKIAGLREILVRVVRTSTEDANRRMARRYPVTVPSEILDSRGERRHGDVLDVSETGAQIRCSPEIRPGETGSLRLQGIAAALPFVVRAKGVDRLHVELQLTGASKDSYLQWLNSQIGNAIPRAS